MDCAATLSGIKDSSEYDTTMNSFNEATALRTKIRNGKKKYPDGHLSIKNGIGYVIIEFSDNRPLFRVYQSYNFIKKYLPEIHELIENKDKNEFIPKYSDTDDLGFDFNKINKNPRLHENDYTFKIDDYDIIIKDVQEEAPSGNINDLIGIFISKNSKILKEDSTYMPKDVKHILVYNLNDIDFENYNH